MGFSNLRCGKTLKPGFVVTDEPGIYFIPTLIDMWKAEGKFKKFINYDKLETYKDFGGIRIEDARFQRPFRRSRRYAPKAASGLR